MNGVFKVYQRLLIKYPLGMQALQAGSLMGFGDQLAQNLVERRKFENLNFVRTAQFVGIGFFIGGPTTRTWYGVLDKYVGSKGGIVAIKKVVLDQLFFAPTFIAVLLCTIGALQGLTIEDVQVKFKAEYLDILFNNYKKENARQVYVENEIEKHLMDQRRAWVWKLKIGKQVSECMKVYSLHFVKDDYFNKGLATQRGRLSVA